MASLKLIDEKMVLLVEKAKKLRASRDELLLKVNELEAELIKRDSELAMLVKERNLVVETVEDMLTQIEALEI